MELILLRHAPPRREFHGRYVGHTDIGIDPALFDPAKIAPLLGMPFDRVYSSDLSRCTRTLEMMDISDYTADARLREVRFRAPFEGKSFAEIERLEGYDPSVLDSADAWHRFVCAESAEAFAERLRSFLDTLPPLGAILVCTHAGVIRELLSQLSPSTPPVTPGYLEYTRVRVK